jgi:hypothetical protein
MKKILITLMGVTFINVAFAFDGWFSPDQARCKVEYTRLDLVTGIETRKKHTYQSHDDGGHEENCPMYASLLAKKIEYWLYKSRNNILVDMSAMYCKMRTDDGIFSNVWTKYKQCDADDSLKLLRLAKDYGSNFDHIGYNAHELRIKGIIWEREGVSIDPFYD